MNDDIIDTTATLGDFLSSMGSSVEELTSIAHAPIKKNRNRRKLRNAAKRERRRRRRK